MTEMPHLIGGALGLDFVNTVDPRHATERREYLDSYPALVAWGSHASRRWCDMRVCGNRAKARRHYERTLALANRSRSRAASAV